jgi:hypothetical protein
MDNLYSITGFQWFVILAVSFIWGCLGFYLSGNDLNHRLKLFGLFSVGSLVAFIVLKFFGQI